MAISVKTDINYLTYGDEMRKLRELAEQYSGGAYVPLTTSGDVSWTSNTSSTTYSTASSSNPLINGKGTSGLLYWLKSLFLLDTGSNGYGNSLLDASYLAEIVAAVVSSSAIYAEDGGASDAYAASLPNAPSGYTSGMVVHFKANTANSAGATLNVNGLGAKNILTKEGSTIRTGTIMANDIVSVIYDGTSFRLLNSTPDIVTANLIQYKADAGSTDDYAITLDYPPAAYYEGMSILFSANTANTGAATINVNSLGSKALKDLQGNDLVTGAIAENQIVLAVYTGVYFQVISARGDVVTLSSAQELSSKTMVSPLYKGSIDGWINPDEAWSIYQETKADGDINTGTSAVTVAVDITTGTPILWTTAAPTGLSINTTYYAIRVDATHIKFASSLANALAGTNLTITAVGSGTRVLNIFDRFTVTGDQTAKYRIGTRLKWTQNGTIYYDTVSTSVYGSVTRVKIRGDMNFFGNYAISANYYSYEYCPSGYTVDTGWINVPYSTTYDSTSIAQYRKVNGAVCIIGQFNRDSGDVANADVWGTLPVGFRPKQLLSFPMTGTSTVVAKIGINPDGTITVNGTPSSATTWGLVDSANFYVD